MNLKFYKYQATGNDFILIDDRNETFNIKGSKYIKSLCKRRYGIGADGLILLRNHEKYDFEMIFFNSTGERSTFCGNGARCIIAFSNYLNITKDTTTFMAYDGIHKGIFKDNNVSLQMSDVDNINIDKEYTILDTGSPHLVKIIESIENFDVLKYGSRIRYDKKFGNYGINVNFVEIVNDKIFSRTYERGDEMESLSCGTGSVATAISLHKTKLINTNDIVIHTKGGELNVKFDIFNQSYKNIWLTGEAKMSYSGDLKC